MEHILFFQMIYRNVSTTKFGKKHVDPILYTPLLLHVFILLFDSFFGCFSPLAEFLIMDESVQTGQKILKSPGRPKINS